MLKLFPARQESNLHPVSSIRHPVAGCGFWVPNPEFCRSTSLKNAGNAAEKVFN